MNRIPFVLGLSLALAATSAHAFVMPSLHDSGTSKPRLLDVTLMPPVDAAWADSGGGDGAPAVRLRTIGLVLAGAGVATAAAGIPFDDISTSATFLLAGIVVSTVGLVLIIVDLRSQNGSAGDAPGAVLPDRRAVSDRDERSDLASAPLSFGGLF